MQTAESTFSSLERALTVNLIATPEDELASCDATDPVETVLAWSRAKSLDFIPVKNSGSIVGLLDCRGDANAADKSGNQMYAGSAGEAMAHLSEANLISADAGILSFLQEADRTPCRLVISGSRISGIVTLSDLQKLPVRPVIFLLITHLELLMADWLRRRFQGEDDWLDHLSDDRREKVEERWEHLQAGDLAVDRLTATEFCDKREALIKSGDWQMSRTRARNELEPVEDLRNSIAHAGDYASTPETAHQTVETVRLTQQWIERLSADFNGRDRVPQTCRAR